MADETKGKKAVDRRGFLKALGAGASVAVTAAAGSVAPAAAVAGESDVEKKKARYKETEHVKQYYRTNRY